MAADLRSRALAVDRAPQDMEPHIDSPALTMIRTATTPPKYRGDSPPKVPVDFEADSCLARVVATVELARGDAGLLVANTGPALAGSVVEALASQDQQELFYQALVDGRTWTFFAMTEPDRGSDATALGARLERLSDGYRLYGEKRYISNGSRGGVGVVFARTGPSPLTIRAVLVRCPTPGLRAEPLEMVGLRGARISELGFEAVEVPAEHVLGKHLPFARRGVWGAMRAFNSMRVQIGAMAIGVAFAAWDYVREHRPGSTDSVIAARLEAGRRLLYQAAETIDHEPDNRSQASIAKLNATELAVKATRWASAALGPGSLLEHPLLEKWCRDVHAFEFMDGTSNVQRLHIAQGGRVEGGHAPATAARQHPS